MFGDLLYRLRALFRRASLEAELEEELRGHIEQQIDKYLQSGLSPVEAERRARLEFGNIGAIKEECRDSWGVRFLSELAQDVRFGLRQLRRNPGFTIVAVLTLALGIGANTAMFNLVYAMLLRPLPVPNPGRLVELYTTNPAYNFLPYNLFSYPMLEEITRDQRVFSEVSGWGAPMLLFEINGQTFPGGLATVTGNYFHLLGLRPAIGRLLVQADDAGPTPRPVVVISYRFWHAYYSGSPSVLGKILKISGHPYTIVGVTPKDFFGLLTGLSIDAWRPLIKSAYRNRKFQDLWITARLNEGVSIGQARVQIEALWPSILHATVPEKMGGKERNQFLAQRIRVVPAKTGVLPVFLSAFRRPLIFLMCAAAVVLLLACLNLAGLMLSRTAAREHEIGVRAALGASRRRLVQQLLTEGMLLAASGAMLAIPFALWASRSLVNFVWTGNVQLGLDLSLSSHVVEFAGAIALLAGAVIGFAPSWWATRGVPSALLQENTRTLTGRSGQALGKWLLAMQLALSFVLVVGAGLMTRSLVALVSINPGFRTEGVLDLLLQPKPGGYKDFHPESYYQQLIGNLAALPGVRSVSLSRLGPVGTLEYREPVSKSPSDSPMMGRIDAVFDAVSPRFFQTLGISLLRGRDFEFSDDAHAPHVAIISEGLARHLFPVGEALGHLINVGTQPNQQNLRIVGVVSDANLYDVKVQRPPAVYLPFFQSRVPEAPDVQIRAAGNPQSITAPVRRQIDELGREYVFRMQTLHRALMRSLVREQTLAMLADGYGALALLLATIGLYGLLAYSVARRTHEIGIRMALGAQKNDVLKMIIRQGLKLALVGVAIGVAGALALTRFLASLLYGVKPTDPLTFVAVSLILIAVALVACYIPARRAAKVDPMVALRCE